MFGFFKKTRSAIDNVEASVKIIEETAETISETADTIEETARFIKIAEFVKLGMGAVGLIFLGIIAAKIGG